MGNGEKLGMNIHPHAREIKMAYEKKVNPGDTTGFLSVLSG